MTRAILHPRARLTSLVFESFEVVYPQVVFRYRFERRRWQKTMGIGDIPIEALAAADQNLVNNVLAHIGISCARYFFSIEDFDHLYLEAIQLPRDAILGLEMSFQRQLAEMRYRNRLNTRKPLEITCAPDAPSYRPVEVALEERALMMNGGGKDTVVAGEILKTTSLPFTWLTVHSPITPAMEAIQRCSGRSEAIHIEHRGWDPKIHRSAQYEDVLAPRLTFISLLPAVVCGFRYLIMANEYSANFGNLRVKGREINHQDGKSLAGARRFNAYVKRYIVKGVRLFSIVSPLYEIQIAKIFARFPAYFPHFVSCNIGHRRNFWCGKCAKCAFIFLVLGAFLEPEQVRAIFGRDLFSTPRIRHWIDRLTRGRKPFECVGTREESQLALALAMARQGCPKDLSASDWQSIAAGCAGIDQRALEQELLDTYDRSHNIPSDLRPAVMDFFGQHFGPSRG